MRRISLLTCATLYACSPNPTPTPTPAPAPAPAPALAPAPAPALDPSEACAQILVVAYAGAAHASSETTRDKPAAEQRARDLLARLGPTADFAALASAESDAKTSAARGGVIGTFHKDEWPKLHAAIRDTVFGLNVAQTAPAPVAADYGYVLVRRCAVEKARSRHILVRYAGAKNAGPEIARSKAQAQARARELRAKLDAGEDFAALARSASDDASAERGGDLGPRGRGVLALAYETALFGLQPGERSQPVESEFGFHVIERLPDTP